MSAQERIGIRNVVQTPGHTNCRACHYAGFSNICAFFEGDECFYISFKKALNSDSPVTTAEKIS